MKIDIRIGDKLYNKNMIPPTITVTYVGEDKIEANTTKYGILPFMEHDFGKVLFFDIEHSSQHFDNCYEYFQYVTVKKEEMYQKYLSLVNVLKAVEKLRLETQELIGYFNDNYIDENKPFELDTQQAESIVKDAANILISARAGSGKTRVIIAKILYLLEREGLPWDSIYILTFNKDASEEIASRIHNNIILKDNPKKYLNLDINKTFHKLAKNWSDYNGDILAKEKKRFIKIIIEDLKENNPEFKEKVYKFFRQENMKVEKKNFKDPKDYYIYIRNLQYRTLKGDFVKSKGEKWIADFLFENGINYYYEYSFYPSYVKENDINGDDDLKKRCLNFLKKYGGEIKPDFYLKNENIIWEHWGINAQETDNEKKQAFSEKFNLTWQEYYENMLWKKDFWQPKWRKELLVHSQHWAIDDICNVKELIETSVNDLTQSREMFENKITEILKSKGIKVERRNQDEIIQDVWESAIDHFTELMESFINRYQQKYINNKDDFIKNTELYINDERVFEFLRIGLQVLEHYNYILSLDQKNEKFKEYQQYKIDFNQILIRAQKRIDNGYLDEEIQKIEYILIDEYQDFSELFYQFILSIKSRNPNIKLFCVGDNWQAINRFAGSDTRYFDNFKKYFDNCIETNISTNYRSSKELINSSNTFMKNNGFIGKQANANGNNKNGLAPVIKEVDQIFIAMRDDMTGYKFDQNFIEQFNDKNDKLIKAQYLKQCFEIVKDNLGKNILILHRNNKFMYSISIDEFLNKLFNVLEKENIYTKDESKKLIDIKTIHKSKGLQADVVILLEVNQGIIPMIHPDNSLFEIFGENFQVSLADQERLFYVAMTRAKERLYILCEKDKKSDYIKYL